MSGFLKSNNFVTYKKNVLSTVNLILKERNRVMKVFKILLFIASIIVLSSCSPSPYGFDDFDASEPQTIEIGVDVFRVPIPRSNDYEIIENIDTTILGRQTLVIKVNEPNGSYQIIGIPYDIVDTTNPRIVVEGQSRILLEAGETLVLPEIEIFDNHVIVESGVNIDYEGGIANISFAPLGNYDIEFTATDASGNTSTLARILTIRDTQEPTVTIPPKIYVLLGEIPLKPVLTMRDNYDSVNDLEVNYGPIFQQRVRDVRQYNEVISVKDTSENERIVNVLIESIHNESSLFEFLVELWNEDPENEELEVRLNEYQNYRIFPQDTLRLYQDIFDGELRGNLEETLAFLDESAPVELTISYLSSIIDEIQYEEQRFKVTTLYNSGIERFISDIPTPTNVNNLEALQALLTDASGIVPTPTIESGIERLWGQYLGLLEGQPVLQRIRSIDASLERIQLLESNFNVSFRTDYLTALDSGLLEFRDANMEPLELRSVFVNDEFQTRFDITNQQVVISGLLVTPTPNRNFQGFLLGSGVNEFEVDFNDQLYELDLSEIEPLYLSMLDMITTDNYDISYIWSSGSARSRIFQEITQDQRPQFSNFALRLEVELIAKKWDR